MIARPEKHHLRRGFSTLGCPELSLEQICDVAAQFDIAEVELRTVRGRMDLDCYFLQEKMTPAQAGALFASRRVRPRLMGSSFKLIGHSAADREALVRYSEWADSWGAAFVRVFSGGIWGEPIEDEHFQEAAEAVTWWRGERETRGWTTELILETHDAFCASQRCLKLMERLPRPISILWDSHHTWRLGGESPAETWELLSPLICQVHIKDSISKPSARHPFSYVLPGDGEMPLAETVALLHEKKFAGVVSLEWEKQWHPYLPSITEALARLRAQDWFVPALNERSAFIV